ncbi:hypothetical protein Sgleb_04520 [Streptomyces glebosus]|uniref:LysR substrate-binding domain-containing protein n=1 Tax=Streptomyces glebosus TaxID=249580 RepID=A0A640SSD4_9ACTN|nr:hypothetical protein Sgleb_04520 [Streptomyces glebosus]GHG82907.1 hypothetical protein GCM10010513_62150 [Streptomyces glebosus]
MFVAEGNAAVCEFAAFRRRSPLEYGLAWRAATDTGRIRAFAESAVEMVRRQGDPGDACAECR